ncbi:MAG: hypothetical protein GKS01_20005 [Alphaproteobacteria bacterium]|nr:hypothetical protein [Alphaproteobacteria bacterium]
MTAHLKKLLLVLSILVLGFGPNANAMEARTEAAKVMAIKAAEHIKLKGQKAAFAAFETKGGEYHDKALYVFVLNLSGSVVSHGADKNLIGKNLLNIKDTTGKEFVKEFVNTAKTKGVGWVDYVWPHPTTKNPAPKSSYILQVGKNLLVGVGAYK